MGREEGKGRCRKDIIKEGRKGVQKITNERNGKEGREKRKTGKETREKHGTGRKGGRGRKRLIG